MSVSFFETSAPACPSTTYQGRQSWNWRQHKWGFEAAPRPQKHEIWTSTSGNLSFRPKEFCSADVQDVQSPDVCALTCFGWAIREVLGSCNGVTRRSSGAADQQGCQRGDGFDLRLEELEDVEVGLADVPKKTMKRYRHNNNDHRHHHPPSSSSSSSSSSSVLDAICFWLLWCMWCNLLPSFCLVRQPPQSVIHRLKSGARGRLSTWKARHGNGIHGWFTYWIREMHGCHIVRLDYWQVFQHC